jgi:hypothetical protein
MVERFEKGKKYKFSKEQFISHMLDLDKEMCEPWLDIWESKGSWVQECDGKEVDIHHSYSGGIGVYVIAPEWCVKVIPEDDAYRISRGIHYALNYAIHNLNEEPNMVFMTRDVFTICQEQDSFEICEDINGNPQYEIFGYPIKVIDGEDEIYVGHVGEAII